MKDFKYEKLMAQEYLNNLDVHLTKTMTMVRLRMAKFNGNFRGQACTVMINT